MTLPLLLSHGTFSRGKKSATAGTAIVHMVPPYRNQYGAPQGVGTPPNPLVTHGVPHITDFVYLIGTTAHTLTILRPLNYTTVASDAAASQAVINITADPGLFQTAGRYQYALPNGLTAPSTGNNAIAANDIVVYQAAAGQWILDTVSSVATLAITMTGNVPTGGVKAGALFYWFGITTDTDPATNEAHQQMDIDAAASGTSRYALQNQNGIWQAYHAGDPIVLSSSNGTTAGTFEVVAGVYAKH